MTRRAVLVSLVPLLVFSTAGCRRQSDRAAAVAASNSLLECAARDLLGQSAPIMRLAEPGMCPGHFDVRPSQVAALRRCRVLLRLDFQKSLDAKLAGARDDGLRIAEVRITGGLCEPDSYLAACRQTADALVEAGLLDGAAAEHRLGRIADRMGRLAAECKQAAGPLRGTPVVASVHQEAFCRWLGLKVVATFRAADVESAQRLDDAIRIAKGRNVRLVVANLPEGRRAADFLADGLGGRVVVFGNFPALDDGHCRFDDLVRDNVARLLEATSP